MNIHEEGRDSSEFIFISFKLKSDLLHKFKLREHIFFLWLKNQVSKGLKQTNTSSTQGHLS